MLQVTSPSFFVGPSGWSYPHWKYFVFPRPCPRGFHPLEFLASKFDTVEINQGFLGALRPELVILWNKMTSANKRFRFTVRLHRDFTYERKLEPQAVDAFRRALHPLLERKRLGCVVMQFPWAFRFNSENRDYLVRVRRAFHEFPLVAEFRHESWMSSEALGVLIDYRVGFANIDQPASFRAMPATSLLTSPVGYVRLYGRKAHGRFQSFQEGQPQLNYLYPLAELEEWKKRVEHIARFADSVYVSFANSHKGQSVVNALQMKYMLSTVAVQPEAAVQPALRAA